MHTGNIALYPVKNDSCVPSVQNKQTNNKQTNIICAPRTNLYIHGNRDPVLCLGNVWPQITNQIKTHSYEHS